MSGAVEADVQQPARHCWVTRARTTSRSLSAAVGCAVWPTMCAPTNGTFGPKCLSSHPAPSQRSVARSVAIIASGRYRSHVSPRLPPRGGEGAAGSQHCVLAPVVTSRDQSVPVSYGDVGRAGRREELAVSSACVQLAGSVGLASRE